MARYALLVNSLARAHASRAVGAAVAERLVKAGAEVIGITAPTRQELEDRARAIAVEGVDAVIACGGDGMVHLAVQALATTGVPLAVVPAGSGCDFARSLGLLDLRDPAVAAAQILRGQTLQIDLPHCEYGWFASVLNSGFDSRTTQRAEAMAWPKGPMRYKVAVAPELAKLAPIPFELTLDGTVTQVEATMIAVGNTCYYGGGMKICPDADCRDGLLDVIVVEPLSRRELLAAFPSLFSGRHIEHRKVRAHRAAVVGLATPDLPAERVTADGEILGPMPVVCETAPGALTVLV